MTPFEPGGPQIPSPPFEVPQPDLPAADFVAIGHQIATGSVKSGFWDSFIQAIVNGMANIVGAVLAALVGLVEWVVGGLLKIVVRALVANEASTNEIAATVVAGMTGRPVSANVFSDATARGSRDEVSVNLVNDVLAALQTGQGQGDGTGVTPGKSGAEAFLKLTSHMAIEGWLIGWLADAFSVHELEQLGSLKDGLERSLGLGRLARRALSAPMKILVEDPFTYLLNSQYRPTLPSVELLVRQYIRGFVKRDRLDTFMGYHGYQNADVEALINFNRSHLSPADIVNLLIHDQLSGEIASGLLAAQGYDDATQTQIIVALENSRLDEWDKQLIGELFTALKDHLVTADEIQSVIDGTHLPKAEKAKLGQILAIREKLARKRFSISEGEQLVKKFIWGLDQFRTLATELGYTLGDETSLELLLLHDIKTAGDAAAAKQKVADARTQAAKAKALALAEKAKTAAAAAEAKGVGVAKFEALVLDNLKSITEYRTFLLGKGIAADNITALAAALQAKLDKAAAAAAARPGLAAGAKAHNLDLAQLEAAVKTGTLTLPEFSAKLEQIGFTADDTQLLTSVLSDQLDSLHAKADLKAAAAAKVKAKGVDLAQLERGVRLGLVTIDDFGARLDTLGFDPADKDLLVAEMQKQLDADAAARQLKAAVAAASKAKGLKIPQLEAAVRAGVQTIDSYRAALAQAGYDVAAQDSLVSLLQLRMEQDKETLAAKGRAAGLLGQAGLSLADIERAVKLGVIPITVYTDALGRAGVDATDAHTLTLALAVQIKSAKSARTLVATVTADLKLAGLSFAKLEQDVLDSKLSVEQFQSLLGGANVSAADISTIVGLLRDELANQQHVAQLTGSVAGAAAAKGLSLSQEEAAVRAGVKTLEEFSAFVAALGYDAADVATLTETLRSKIPVPTVP
jgi:hypothetical protein